MSGTSDLGKMTLRELDEAIADAIAEKDRLIGELAEAKALLVLAKQERDAARAELAAAEARQA